MPIDPGAAKEAAHRLVTRFTWQAIQAGASEARIQFDGQHITTTYCLNGQWRRQEDMPAALWPQILRRIRNGAFLTLGPQPPRQEGEFNITILDRQQAEERDYKPQLVILHDADGDDIRIVIGTPTRRPYKHPEGFEFICGEKL